MVLHQQPIIAVYITLITIMSSSILLFSLHLTTPHLTPQPFYSFRTLWDHDLSSQYSPMEEKLDQDYSNIVGSSVAVSATLQVSASIYIIYKIDSELHPSSSSSWPSVSSREIESLICGEKFVMLIIILQKRLHVLILSMTRPLNHSLLQLRSTNVSSTVSLPLVS